MNTEELKASLRPGPEYVTTSLHVSGDAKAGLLAVDEIAATRISIKRRISMRVFIFILTGVGKSLQIRFDYIEVFPNRRGDTTATVMRKNR